MEIDEQVINDLIFKELIKRGYSLDGKTRVWNIADSKLWYITPDQAQDYLDLENSAGYKSSISNPEFELTEKNLPEIEKQIGNVPVNLIDLGCGDGKKAAHIVEHLHKKVPVRYCPIDISGYLVGQAIETFSKLKVEVVDFQYNISDFENLENITPLLIKDKFKRNLFILLGYTLGNFEIHDLLYQIRSAMNKGDVFVAVAGVGSSKWEERAKTAKYDKKTNNFFIHIPLLLGLGKDDVEFSPRFKNSRIEFCYVLKKDKEISFQERKVSFNKGDQIIVAVAYKQNKDDLLNIFNMHFDQVILKVSKDGSTALAICKR